MPTGIGHDVSISIFAKDATYMTNYMRGDILFTAVHPAATGTLWLNPTAPALSNIRSQGSGLGWQAIATLSSANSWNIYVAGVSGMTGIVNWDIIAQIQTV